METYLPVLTASEEIYSVDTFLMSILTSIPRSDPSHQYEGMLIVWDTQTGVITRKVNTEQSGEIMFHGDQRTITVMPMGQCFYTYDTLNCMQLCQGEIPLSLNFDLGSHWVYNCTLQFAISSKAKGKFVINIYELQPTSIPPLHILSLFPVPFECPTFSFSVSFHVSFFSEGKVVVFDVQDSKLLLEAKFAQKYPPLGQFSPDGHFFACGISEHEICVWQNTLTGYVPWSSLKPRSPFDNLSWSPTSVSILCWGSDGIYLLHTGNSPTPPSPKVEHPCLQKCHLVAYSPNGIHVATIQKDSGVVTVLDCLSGTKQQFTNTCTQIQDIKITHNTIFAVGAACELISWDLNTGGTSHDTHGAKGMPVIKNTTTGFPPEHITLSCDSSQIAYIRSSTIFLHNIKTQERAFMHTNYKINGIRFSLDGGQLWFSAADGKYYFLETSGGWKSSKVTMGGLEDGQSLFNPSSPHGHHATSLDVWITDSHYENLLWLPPSWRITYKSGVRWGGSFLALLHDHHLEPIVIKFQQQPNTYHPFSSFTNI